MKQFELSKNNLNNLYGLSCVENYLLYVLKWEKYQYKYLYYESFLPFCDIFNAFINENIEYSFFYKVNRIQDTAVKNGLIDFNIYKDIDLLNCLDLHNYICIMVKPEYIRNKYRIKLWRDDHYILLSKSDDKTFAYLNDTPRDIEVITYRELNQIFARRVIGFDICNVASKNQEMEFYRYFYDSLKNDMPSINFDVNSLIRARDILGVLRILRRRIYEYSSLYINAYFLNEYLTRLDKYYTSFEYMGLRNNIDYIKINIILNNVYHEDIQMINQLRSELGGNI